jgi:hypothetical protein
MNESTLTQLKIVVERVVRPVRASTSRKRKMREELLAHILGVFEEEVARLGDDRAALERTALRFGNPADVTSPLQQSVPAGDRIARFFEGRPGEAALWVPIRLAYWASAWELVAVCAVLVLADWVTVLPRETLLTFGYVFLALPVYFIGAAFLTDWIEKGVYGPARAPRHRVALSAAGSLLVMLLFGVGAVWSTSPADSNQLRLSALWYVGWMVAHSVVLAWGLAQWNAPRRRYHEDWGRLPIEVAS